jgi:hypothetical protein
MLASISVMNKPINQHWVPRFYLRYFSTPETRDTQDPKAFVHERESLADSPRFESTKEVCALPYLYTPVQLDGESPRLSWRPVGLSYATAATAGSASCR